MSVRRIERGDKFNRELDRLTRKHPDLPATVEDFLERYSAEGPLTHRRQPGVYGHPVFNERLPLQGKGKRGAARISVYCDDERVVALRLFTKSAKQLLAPKEIRNALRDAGLLENPDDSN